MIEFNMFHHGYPRIIVANKEPCCSSQWDSERSGILPRPVAVVRCHVLVEPRRYVLDFAEKYFISALRTYYFDAVETWIRAP